MNGSEGIHSPSGIRVLADYREARAGTIAALRAMEGLTVEIVHLPVGDYQVADLFVFERKTLRDFAVSVQDGRLFRQAFSLAALPSPKKGVIILEGTSADLLESGMRRESLQGALITVTLFLGIPILRSRDGEESARLMLFAARQARSFATRALPRHGKRPRGKRKAQLALLQGIPGLGPSRAERLLDHFGSVTAILTATPEDLTAVTGVGKQIERNIRWIVSEPEPPSYGDSGPRHKRQND